MVRLFRFLGLWSVGALFFWSLGYGQGSESPGVLRLATSTSASDSGLLDLLIPRFEAETGIEIDLSAVGTGTALRMGRAGKVDVLIVHAPKAERKFVEEAYGTRMYPLMHNDFIVVGPPEDPAKVKGLRDAAETFRKISETGSSFVSRADDSGTNKKELEIWSRAGIEPVGTEWYLELGAGIGATLKYSSEHKAYTLADRGTWLAVRKSTELKLLIEGDPLLVNPYDVIPVNPDKHPHININIKGAEIFADWITSPSVQAVIGAYKVDGQQLFIPVLQEGI